MKRLLIVLIFCFLTGPYLCSRNIGFYTGTFDPPHAGHLNVMLNIKSFVNLDVMYLFPNFDPPGKQGITSFEHRYAMCKVLTDRYHWIRIPEKEYVQKYYSAGGVALLLQTFQKEHTTAGKDKVFQVMGTDSFNKLHSYGKLHEVLDFRTICVVDRPGYQMVQDETVTNAISKGKIILIPRFADRDFSSSSVRECYKNGQISGDIDFFLNGYIIRNGLYGEFSLPKGRPLFIGNRTSIGSPFKTVEVTEEISGIIGKLSSELYTYNVDFLEQYIQRFFNDTNLVKALFAHTGEIHFLFGQESSALRYFRSIGVDTIEYLSGTEIPVYRCKDVIYFTGIRCREQLLNCFFNVTLVLRFSGLKNAMKIFQLERWDYFRMFTDKFMQHTVGAGVKTLVIGFSDHFKRRMDELHIVYSEVRDNHHEALIVQGGRFGKTLVTAHYPGGGSLNESLILSALAQGVRRILFLGSAGSPVKKYETGYVLSNEKFFSYDSKFRLNSFIQNSPDAFGFTRGQDYFESGKNLTVFSPAVESDSIIRRFGFYNFSSIDTDAMFIVRAANTIRESEYGVLQVITNHEGKKGDINLANAAIIKLVNRTVELMMQK